MQSIEISKRLSWIKRLEKCGIDYAEGFWEESRCYAFEPRQVESLYNDTHEIYKLLMEYAEQVCRRDLFEKIGIPLKAVPLIHRSWEMSDYLPTICSRIDLAYDNYGKAKLYECHFECPMLLVESAEAQWRWKEERIPGAMQYNNIYEKLCAVWREYRMPGVKVHFACLTENSEHLAALHYLEDTARRCGVTTSLIDLQQINFKDSIFTDPEGFEIKQLVKIYPLRLMLEDPFGENLLNPDCFNLIEPAWKMILDAPGTMDLLHELYAGHPLILKPCERKAIRSQIGRPIVCSWLIADEPAGIGIREELKFVPHFFQ